MLVTGQSRPLPCAWFSRTTVDRIHTKRATSSRYQEQLAGEKERHEARSSLRLLRKRRFTSEFAGTVRVRFGEAIRAPGSMASGLTYLS
jgi:hypothetical protein